MPDRNYYSSSGGRQDRETTRGWGESARDDDEGRFDRQGYENRDREYGQDEGRSRAGARDQSWQPGRRPNAGQDRYGQSGYGQGGYGQGRGGETRFGNYGEFGDHGRDRGDLSNYNMGYGGQDRGQDRNWGAGGASPYGTSGYGQSGGELGGQSRGMHRGKGPKGYQRSDERLKEMICERLREDPEIDASEVSVTVASGRVTFEGSVDSRRTKNAVEDVAEQLDVGEVQNNLRVTRDYQSSFASSGAAAGTTSGTSSGTLGEGARQKKN